jgi:hypothetical protein
VSYEIYSQVEGLTVHLLQRTEQLSRFVTACAAAVLLLAGVIHPQSLQKTQLLDSLAAPKEPSAEWQDVERAMGRAGQVQPGDVIKFGMPRKDLHVSVHGTEVKAGLALGSWTAFKHSADASIMMGDLVLTEEEVEPVLLKLQQGGIQVTAVHNHLLGEVPRVIYMHISGHGDAVKLAGALQAALALTKTPPAEPQSGQTPFALDQKQIESTLGYSGKVNGGILQFAVARAEQIVDHGVEIPPAMGVATALNFQPTGNARAAISGDFVLTANEVNPVIRVLRENGIAVTAVHSHMLTEDPRLFFLHFWANDDAAKLARRLRAALDQTKSAHAEEK